jgi:hypothetical protein
MLIYMFLLSLIAVITFLVQFQFYSHSNHETSEPDYLEEINSMQSLNHSVAIV